MDGPMDVGIIQDDEITIEKDFSCIKLFRTTGKVSKKMRKVNYEGIEDSVTNYY